MNENTLNLRCRRLIQPRLQLRLIGVFLAVSALGFLLQALLLTSLLSKMAASLPTGGSEAQAQIPALVSTLLVLSFLVLLPLTVSVGILATFRFAGPVHRFEQYLGSVARSEDMGPCRIRKGDEFQELCVLINKAVTRLRADRDAESGTPGERRQVA